MWFSPPWPFRKRKPAPIEIDPAEIPLVKVRRHTPPRRPGGNAFVWHEGRYVHEEDVPDGD